MTADFYMSTHVFCGQFFVLYGAKRVWEKSRLCGSEGQAHKIKEHTFNSHNFVRFLAPPGFELAERHRKRPISWGWRRTHN